MNYFTTFGLAWLREDRAKRGARDFVAQHLRHSCCLTKEVALSGNKDGIVAMHDLFLCSDKPFLFPKSFYWAEPSSFLGCTFVLSVGLYEYVFGELREPILPCVGLRNRSVHTDLASP